MNKHLLALLLTIQVYSAQSMAANACVDLFSGKQAPISREVDKVQVQESKYVTLLNNLRATLTGKLATVWRSEWKTKLSVKRSNQYVFNLINQNLSRETLAEVMKDLDVKDEGFTRHVHERMSNLQKQGLTNSNDKLTVRDAPPPEGATDSTFTYYTKPLVDADGNAKHQPRIRTYLREVDFSEMVVDVPVLGSLADSSKVSFTRKSEKNYELNINGETKTFTAKQLQNRFGKTFKMFAPHGKTYKLEIKSALDDMIESPYYTNLNGNHNVQKLDVTLTQNQVDTLFAPLKGKSEEAQKTESTQRIKDLIAELVAKDPALEARAIAIFDVLIEGVNGNSKFLQIEGATAYHRSAFESTSGFQTTVDRNQGVYLGNMYSNKGLKDPTVVLKNNDRLITGEEDARHVELKLPINLVVDVMGVKFSDPRSAALVQHAPFEFNVIDNVVKLYNAYVTSVDHPGKFNYLRESASELLNDHE
ncbi:hypothetical protein CIK05_06915 [Bdellovibrio sp. qaytius]|nr:hypothetical protein CIK05_06915 [Bdellovibrio sp. qaytius]